MAFNQLDGIVLNKALGIIGKPVDQRSVILEDGVYRDYLSTAEVLSHLTGTSPAHTAAIRTGHFPIYVTPEGENSTIWWFLNGTDDEDLEQLLPGGALQAVTDLGNETTSFLDVQEGIYQYGVPILTTAGGSTAVGAEALPPTNAGGSNTAIGGQAMKNGTSGAHNVALGLRALRDSDGDGNTSLGSYSMQNSIAGNHNVAVGYQTMMNTTGNHNTAVGANALVVNTTGIGNVAVGYNAALGQNSGDHNIAIGYKADLPDGAGSNQLCIGNLIYGTALDGIEGTISSGNIGIGVKVPLVKLHVDGPVNCVVVEYADNAAAVGGGLMVGTFYRTGDALKIVHA